jgi:hypothetical protein
MTIRPNRRALISRPEGSPAVTSSSRAPRSDYQWPLSQPVSTSKAKHSTATSPLDTLKTERGVHTSAANGQTSRSASGQVGWGSKKP